MHCERNLFYKFSARLAASSGCDVHNYKPKTTTKPVGWRKNDTASSWFLPLVGNILKHALMVVLQEVVLICGIQLMDISGSGQQKLHCEQNRPG